MGTITGLKLGMMVAAIALMVAALPPAASAQVQVGDADLGGVVSGPNGPEAGVWVIAETSDLPTKYAKIVVTDDQGRYLIPDLPKAKYSVWVRGYGLVDGAKVEAAPGALVNLKAEPAPSAAAAAQYYPAVYGYSMLQMPDKSLFPGTGINGNGMSPKVKTQAQWVAGMKNLGCFGCHQLGNAATRAIPAALGHFDTAAQAWERRIQSGQASRNMVTQIGNLDPQQAFKQFGEWTDRVAAGELPAAKPPRPQGVERNLVLTLWDWSTPTSYLHDEVSTDRNNPTVNAWGPIYGTNEESSDSVPVLDPVRMKTWRISIPVRDPKTPSAKDAPIIAASAYWGEQPIWDARTTNPNPMIDKQGRVWFTARIRPEETPEWCRKGSDHASAKLFPIEKSGRQLAMYDPKTDKFTLVDTCFQTHHLQFAADNTTLWTSAGVQGSDVVGWLDTKKFAETGDERASQGWTALILDTKGSGKRDVAYVEPDQPLDPFKDKRLRATYYAVSPSPLDGSIWGSIMGVPGGVARIALGEHPPETAITEYYEVPFNESRVAVNGFGPRGMEIDRKGVVWVPLASGQMASFDRSKCKGPLKGPTVANGRQCPEGWTFYDFPGPQFQNLDGPGSAEASYYTWVDQWNTGGLGEDVPMATGNGNEAILALVEGKWVVLRVPYPLGFFAKGMDGRIDDPKAGWKGKGLWSTYATRTPWHI